jgi:pyrroloquinoline quinone (PQQ) biosynthesis protein C
VTRPDPSSHPANGAVPANPVPILHWTARVTREDDAVIVEAEDHDFDLRFEARAPERLHALLALFDGRRSLADAAASAGVPEDVARACADQLVENGLAVSVPDAARQFIAPAEFAALCRRIYPGLKQRLFGHALWKGLTTGEASRAVFMGWLIENYHFIHGVNDRLALAASACNVSELRPYFVKHYVEEWDHYKFFIDALETLGVPAAEVRSTRPLPGTIAALNHMRRCARRDPLEYAACSGFLESTGEDRKSAVGFFERLRTHYGPAGPMAVDQLIAHLHLDEAYQHNTVLEDICSQLDAVSIQRATNALTAARTQVETMALWSTDILRSYDRPALVLRRGLQGHRPARAASGAASGADRT